MVKSREFNLKKSDSLPESLDYSKLPKRISEAITTSQYKIKKESKLTWDGKQFVVRIPKEVTEEMGIKEGEHIKFSITKKFGATTKPKLEIEWIPNGEG